MTESMHVPPDGRDDLRVRALALWATAAALVVIALFFHVLHDFMGHATAIPAAGLAGALVGAAGYRWGGGSASAKGAGYTAAIGGGLGLLALHLLPLLHG